MRSPEEVQRELSPLSGSQRRAKTWRQPYFFSRNVRQLRGVVALHAQQAVDKYLKALLVRRQIDFPKTHDIGRLLKLVESVEPAAAEALLEFEALVPYGVEIRYPDDVIEVLPGEETRLVEIACNARHTVVKQLESYLF